MFDLFVRLLLWPFRVVMALIGDAVTRLVRYLLVIALVLVVIGYLGLAGYHWAEQTPVVTTVQDLFAAEPTVPPRRLTPAEIAQANALAAQIAQNSPDVFAVPRDVPRAQLLQGLQGFMSNETNPGVMSNPPIDDLNCYLATTSQVAGLSAQKWAGAATAQLVQAIVLAPVGQLSVGSAFGDALLHGGAYLLTSIGLQTPSISEAMVSTITGQTVGYIFARTSLEWVDTVSGGQLSSAMTDAVVKKMLKDEGVVVESVSGNVYQTTTADHPDVSAVLVYNPWSRYAVVTVYTSCAPDLALIFRYPVSEIGAAQGRDVTSFWLD